MTPYDPRHDPSFPSDVVNLLRDNRGEWLHPGRIVLEQRGGECDPILLADATYRAVTNARRLGDVIEGDPARGYCYRRFERVRFVDLAWASQWPDVPVNMRSHRRAGTVQGQMALHEAVG